MLGWVPVEYICLAAGQGRRFGRLGLYLQKCMYPIGLRPFLELSLRNLLSSRELDRERDRLTLVIGHHGEQIRDYFGTSLEGLAITYLEQPRQLGTGHALALLYREHRPSQPVIAWLADLYVSKALFEAVRSHREANLLTLAAGPVGESGDVLVSTAGELVTRAWRGAGDLYDIGLWKLAPEVLRRMTDQLEGEYRMLPNLQRAIERGTRVGFVRASEWIHLGGTQPSAEKNVRAVVTKLLELEAPDDTL